MANRSSWHRVLMLTTYPEHAPPAYFAVWRSLQLSGDKPSILHVAACESPDAASNHIDSENSGKWIAFGQKIVTVCRGPVDKMLIPCSEIRQLSLVEAAEIAYGDADVTKLILDHLRDCSADRPSESVLSD